MNNSSRESKFILFKLQPEAKCAINCEIRVSKNRAEDLIQKYIK